GADPDEAGAAAGGAAAVACAAVGLSQQECTRALRLWGIFGSILAPWRTRQRKVAWIWGPGQPNRSYRSRWRKAVSRSSRQSRLTTRRPSQTHSGLPAAPVRTWEASAISSIFFWLSLAALSAAGGFSLGEPLPLP